MLIEIQDKKIGLKFNNYAIEQLTTVKNRDKSMFAFLTTLVWCAYNGWCFAKQTDPELEFEQVSDWVDSSINDTEVSDKLNEVYKMYQDSEAYKRMQKKSELNGKLEALPADEEK